MKRSVYLLSGSGGVTPALSLSGPTTKKNLFLCVFPNKNEFSVINFNER